MLRGFQERRAYIATARLDGPWEERSCITSTATPLSVMEVIAARRPIAATAVGCIPEIVPESAGPPGLSGRQGAGGGDGPARPRHPARRGYGASCYEVARERFDVTSTARTCEEHYAHVA